MDDPLLSFLAKKDKSKLIYVQHGGGYGLSKDHQAWQIEEDGAEKMLFWGTGDTNVYPTRYRNKYFSKINKEILIILDNKQNYESIRPFIKLSENINTNIKKRCIVVSHPNGLSFNNKYIQKGVGYRQHEKAQLVVYDRISQSLLYARILSKRPFLVIDDNSNKAITPISENAIKFLSLLKEVGILVSIEELNDSVKFWASFSPKEASEIFGQKVQPFFDHILGQPKIETLFEV
jgi:hypothetical protein